VKVYQTMPARGSWSVETLPAQISHVTAFSVMKSGNAPDTVLPVGQFNDLVPVVKQAVTRVLPPSRVQEVDEAPAAKLPHPEIAPDQ